MWWIILISGSMLRNKRTNKSADDAMNQIDLKNYPERFALCGLPVVKVGINFDSERHTIEDWALTFL